MEFQKVQTEKYATRFQVLWEDFCEEKSIPYLNVNSKSEQYLLLRDKMPIGTIQFAPFSLNNPESEIDRWYSFSSNEEVQKLYHEGKSIYELSKLSIKRSERGKGEFKKLITLISVICQKKNMDYCAAVVSERLYLYIISNGFPCIRLEEEVALNENTKGIPILLHVKDCMEQIFIFPWYRDLLVQVNQRFDT